MTQNRHYALTPQSNSPTLKELEGYKRKAEFYDQLRSIALILFFVPVIISIIGTTIRPGFTSNSIIQEIFALGFFSGIIGFFSIFPMYLILAFMVMIGDALSRRHRAIYANTVILIGIMLLLLGPVCYWYWGEEMGIPSTLSWVVGLWLLGWPSGTIGKQFRTYSRYATPQTNPPPSSLQSS